MAINTCTTTLWFNENVYPIIWIVCHHRRQASIQNTGGHKHNRWRQEESRCLVLPDNLAMRKYRTKHSWLTGNYFEWLACTRLPIHSAQLYVDRKGLKIKYILWLWTAHITISPSLLHYACLPGNLHGTCCTLFMFMLLWINGTVYVNRYGWQEEIMRYSRNPYPFSCWIDFYWPTLHRCMVHTGYITGRG